MAKGENIFKRRDGRWEARYIKGRELSGKIRYGFCYGRTYKEAKEKVTQRKAAVLNGSPAPETGSRHRLAFYCDRWLELRRPKVKEATYIKYSTALEKHIKPRLGGCFPLGITGGLTDAFARELLEAGLSPKTVRDILAVLHGVLKYTAAQFPGIFPAVEIPYPKCGRKEMRVLSREEQQRLADYLLADLDPCRFGVLLAMHTGIRIGELCALRWSSISLKDRTLRISATLQRLRDTQEGGTRIVTGSPKSETSLRVIPLTDSAAALCGRMQPRNPAAYVLSSPGRRRGWSPGRCNTAWKSTSGPAGWRGSISTPSGTPSPPGPWRPDLRSSPFPRSWATPAPPSPWSGTSTPPWS